MRQPVVIVLGPDRKAVSGVSTHLNLLFASRLSEQFSLVHFQVGREGRSEGRFGRLIRFAVSPLCLAIAILRRGAAIVHLNTSLNVRAYWRDLVYMIVAKACGAQIVCQVHGGALPQQFCGRSRILAACLRGALHLPDAIVVLASVELEAYRGFVPRQQVLVLPNGIDCAPYERLAREESNASLPLRLVYIGRLAREKGLYDVLAGLKIARAQGTKARLVIAGSGSEEARLRQSASELGLGGDVSFVAPVFGESKTKLLGAADAFLLPSYSEGLPYALLESMAAGVPVIATRVGAISDVVVEGVHGLFVPQRDPKAVSRAVTKLASDRGSLARMSAACRRRITTGYSIDRLAAEFGRLYAELCAVKRVKTLMSF